MLNNQHWHNGYRDGIRETMGSPPSDTNEAFDYWLGWHEGKRSAGVFTIPTSEFVDWPTIIQDKMGSPPSERECKLRMDELIAKLQLNVQSLPAYTDTELVREVRALFTDEEEEAFTDYTTDYTTYH